MAAKRLPMAPGERVPSNAPVMEDGALRDIKTEWADTGRQVPDEPTSLDPEEIILALEHRVAGETISMKDLSRLRKRVGESLKVNSISLNVGVRILEICNSALMRDILARIAHEKNNGGIDEEKRSAFFNEAITLFGQDNQFRPFIEQIKIALEL